MLSIITHTSVCIILLQYVIAYPISCDDAIRGLGCLPLNSEGDVSSSSYHDILRRRGGYKKEEKKLLMSQKSCPLQLTVF